MKQLLLFPAVCLAVSLSAQSTINTNFSWASLSSTTTSSSAAYSACQSNLTVTLQTGLPHQLNNNGSNVPLSMGHPSTSPLIPYPTTVNPLMFNITISFSSPVDNVRILVRDLDDDQAPAGPEETLSNFMVNSVPVSPTSTQAITGSYASSLTTITPLAANCNGWINFNTPGISSISFNYSRYNFNYALLLDSLIFDCDRTISINEQDKLALVSVSPNPATNLIHIEQDKAAELCWKIFSITGSLVRSGNFAEKKTSIDVAELSSGMYHIVLDNGISRSSRKLVIVH